MYRDPNTETISVHWKHVETRGRYYDAAVPHLPREVWGREPVRQLKNCDFIYACPPWGIALLS
eukprot:1353237-Pyramimonas_sp.AAC.1